jgi:hypothetical protein
MATFRIPNGFITIPDHVDSTCPHCDNVIPYNENWFDKMVRYKTCKKCGEKIGITSDYNNI